MPEPQTTPAFDEWAILELMGHVRLAGKVSQQNLFGTALLRIDIPDTQGGYTTQFFGPGSIYRLTPVTAEIACAVARSSQPEPVHRWELPAPRPDPESEMAHDPTDDDDDEDDHYPPL